MIEFLVKSPKHSRFIKAGSAEVAAKRFLNYLRRYTDERPETIQIDATVNGKLTPDANVTVEWYTGPLEASQFSGAPGEWWKLKSITRKELPE